MPFLDYMKVVSGVSLNQDRISGLSPLKKKRDKLLYQVYNDTVTGFCIRPGHIFGVKTDYPKTQRYWKIKLNSSLDPF